MPMLCLVFGASLLDRSNISSAYVAGMAKDLELTIGKKTICLGINLTAADIYCSHRKPLFYLLTRFLPNLRPV